MRDQQTFSIKGPDTKYSWLSGPQSLPESFNFALVAQKEAGDDILNCL